MNWAPYLSLWRFFKATTFDYLLAWLTCRYIDFLKMFPFHFWKKSRCALFISHKHSFSWLKHIQYLVLLFSLQPFCIWKKQRVPHFGIELCFQNDLLLLSWSWGLYFNRKKHFHLINNNLCEPDLCPSRYCCTAVAMILYSLPAPLHFPPILTYSVFSSHMLSL